MSGLIDGEEDRFGSDSVSSLTVALDLECDLASAIGDLVAEAGDGDFDEEGGGKGRGDGEWNGCRGGGFWTWKDRVWWEG